MADYGDMSTIIGQMKRAAIDCFMADQSFSPHWADDNYYAKWGWMRSFYERPAADGSGGGACDDAFNDSLAPTFDEIRGVIDAKVSPWLGLPDGDACQSPRDAANSTTALLGGSSASATVEGGGELATSNSNIQEVVINKLKGSFVAPFLDKYHTQFSKVSHGLADACVILEANYAAEQAMWPAAKNDVASICDAAREAWEKQAADSAAANATLTLTVVAAVAGVVSAVVTAGTGTVAAVAALGSLAAVANSAVAKISADAVINGSSYLEILSSLDEALGKLDSTIFDQEIELQKLMVEAATTMRNDLGSYDLDAFALKPYPTNDNHMQMERSDTDIVSMNMTRIENVLGTASSTLGSGPASNPTPRDWGIGLGGEGTHSSASTLWSVTARCLSLTATEYARGHSLFDATVEDYFGTDADARQTVNNLLADERLTSELGV